MLALAGDEGLEPSYLDLEASVLAAERISRQFLWRSQRESNPSFLIDSQVS